MKCDNLEARLCQSGPTAQPLIAETEIERYFSDKTTENYYLGSDLDSDKCLESRENLNRIIILIKRKSKLNANESNNNEINH